LAAAAVLSAGLVRAEEAAPWWSLPALPWPSARNALIFASLDAGPGQRFGALGIKWAPAGTLDESGFRLLVRGGGAERTREGRLPIAAEAKGESQALLGGELLTGRGAIGVFFGHESALGWTAAERRFGLPPRMRSGLRIQADLWDHPLPDLLIHLSAAASTAAEQVWGRAALGWRPLGLAFLGPEIEATASSGYGKWRIGAHLSGLRLFGLEWRLSGGRERASDGARGLYATLSVQWRK
jgi:hypothetical protein